MKRLLDVLQAITGFAGSSESPEKVSLRLMAIFVGVSSQVVPFLTLVVAHTMPNVQPDMVQAVADQLTNIVQPFILLGATLMWLVGAFKAGYKAWVQPKVQGWIK